MNLKRQTLLAASLAGMVTLAGCGQEPAVAPASAPDKAEVAAPVSPPPVAPAAPDAQAVSAANANSLLPRYTATLAEGITFATPGFPEFVVEASGISGPEDWGRWTDANLGPAKLRFREPLPQNFTLRLKVRDFFGINAGQNVSVHVGAQQQDFVLQGEQDQIVELQFDGAQGADTIEFSVPKLSDPTPTDGRRMGLGLISLSIHE